MNEIVILKIVPEWGDASSAVFPIVLRDAKNLVLIDCGYIGSLPLLEAAFSERGLSVSALTHVLITHHDHDHVGALCALKRAYPRVKIICGQDEAPYLSGDLPPLRLTQARAMQGTLESEAKNAGEAFIAMLETVEPANPELLVREGDVLPFCGGCEVLATPGHTLGHISFYLPKQSALITGDAAVVQDGRLMIANPEYAEDLRLAQQSFDRLMRLNAETIICYHGGVFHRSIDRSQPKSAVKL